MSSVIILLWKIAIACGAGGDAALQRSSRFGTRYKRENPQQRKTRKGAKDMTQTERITYYEKLMEKAEKAVTTAEKAAPMLRELEAYYTGSQWREDFAADEAGKLPAGLKRGVLSEDGIYNLLERFREIGGLLDEAEGK